MSSRTGSSRVVRYDWIRQRPSEVIFVYPWGVRVLHGPASCLRWYSFRTGSLLVATVESLSECDGRPQFLQRERREVKGRFV